VSFAEIGRQYRRQTAISTSTPVALVRNIIALVRIWRTRARIRRELAALGARELQDMGTCWSSIADEVSKPFWQA
jgi:uncharacterized protein YjiS (DUF1127 family)